MNTQDIQNVGASQEAVVNSNNEISFIDKAKAVASKVCDSVKEFAHEVLEDPEGRKLLKDLGVAISLRLAFRHPLTAGIAIGIVGHQVWQEIKAAKEALNH